MSQNEFDIGKAKKYVTLHRQKRALEAELQALKESIGTLEAELSEQFIANGMQNVTVDGATVFLARQLLASTVAGQADALAAQLKVLGLGDLAKITVNANTLSSYIRELPTGENEMPVLPEALAGLVNIREIFSVRVNER